MIHFLVLYLAICLSPARAATPSPGVPSVFLPKAHLLNLNVLRAATLAARRTCDLTVRAYAHELWIDHDALDRQVTGLLDRRGIGSSLARLDPREAARVRELTLALARLASQKTCAFDRSLVLTMRDTQLFAIQLFSRAYAAATDPETRGLAAGTLPKLRLHLAQAEHLLRR